MNWTAIGGKALSWLGGEIGSALNPSVKSQGDSVQSAFDASTPPPTPAPAAAPAPTKPSGINPTTLVLVGAGVLALVLVMVEVRH